MNKLVLIAVFLTLANIVQGQNKYDWEINRDIYPIDDTTNSEILLKRHEQFDYVVEDNQLVVYHTLHDIFKVMNDDAVNANNRIYISMYNTIDISEIKARTISPDGNIQLLDQSEIKEIKDDEAGQGYRIFAIEGATVGGEIEYLYKRKLYASYFGLQYMQFDSPVKNTTFKLTSPSYLEFEFKSYNGLPQIESESTESENIYTLTATNIPTLKDEPFSIYNEHRQKLGYKLNYNLNTGRVKLFTWEKVGKTIYDIVYDLEKKEEKIAEKLLKKVAYDGQEKLLRAAAIEEYVKKNFFLEKNASNETRNFDFINTNKFTNSLGLTRLMANLYKLDGFDPHLVMTSDRSKFKLDPNFESYDYLTDYLIYLPSLEKYIVAYNFEDRLYLTPAQFTANNALITKNVDLMGETFPVTETGYINAASAEENFDNMDVIVSFDDNLSSNTIELKRSFKGYQASYIKSFYPLIQEDEKKELLKDLVKFMSQDADISTMEFESTEFNYKNWHDPLVVNSSFKSKAFIEKAGTSILFKVGELIGPQSELYQENKRLLPVANEYNRLYNRRIEIKLPENYKIQNIDDLIIHEEAKNDSDEVVYLFKSEYKLVDNLLTVKIEEYYDQIYFPKSRFEDFRRVINAAADFNKIVLVLKN